MVRVFVSHNISLNGHHDNHGIMFVIIMDNHDNNSYHVLQHMLSLDSFFLCWYVDEFDIDTTNNVIHKHIPFVVFLIKITQD